MAENVNNKKKRRRSPGFVAGLVILFIGIVILITLAMFTSFDEVTNVFEAGKVDIVLTEPEWNPNDSDNIVPNTVLPKNPAIVNKDETVNTYVFLKVTVPYDDSTALQIEKAKQDTSPAIPSAGGVVYTNTDGKKVPVYKFVATEKPTQNNGSWTDPTDIYNCYNHDYGSPDQKTNPGWYLLKVDESGSNPIINTENKTYTYIYAYVGTTNNSSNENPPLCELIHGASTQYPLFNKIYMQNFREREGFPGARSYNVTIEAFGIQANFLKPNNTTTTIPEEVWPYIDKDYTYNSATGKMTKTS